MVDDYERYSPVGSGFPRRWGPFRLFAELGRGALARVYRARRWGAPPEEPDFALKVLDSMAGIEEQDARQTLIHEARIGAWLRHRNIVRVGGSGEYDGAIWVAMERVEGSSVEWLLLRGGAMPPTVVIDLLIQACAGLHHAHEWIDQGRRAGLVHRDLKPGNLLVDRLGALKVCDFGIAKATELVTVNSQITKGTPCYMSPEQVMNKPIDRRTDVFSLAVVAWEMLTRRRLFDGGALFAIVMAVADVDDHVASTKALDAVPPALRPVLAAAMSGDPSARPASMLELGDLLGRARAEIGDGPTPRAWVAPIFERWLPRG